MRDYQLIFVDGSIPFGIIYIYVNWTRKATFTFLYSPPITLLSLSSSHVTCNCFHVLSVIFHVHVFNYLSHIAFNNSKKLHQDIVDDLRYSEVLYLPGVMTPTEVKPFLILKIVIPFNL